MSPLVAVHVAAGAVGLVSGAVAMIARKGGRAHRAAGQAFFGSMLVMGGLGAAIAVLVPDRITTLAGMLAVYLVSTGWMAVRRPVRQVGRFETIAMAVAIGLALFGLSVGWLGAQAADGRVDGLPFQAAVVFGTVASIGAVGDCATLRRGGLAGPPRIARHLWRLSTALLLACSAFFLGQQKVMPQVLHGSPLLFIPVFAPLAGMLFWLVRVRLPRRLTSSAS